MGSREDEVLGTIETIAYTSYRYDIDSILQRGVESMRQVNSGHHRIERSPKLPGWLKPVNAVMKLLQRSGIPSGSIHLISVPGRRTGEMRTTPVSPFTVGNRRYILSFGETEWVRNARAAGWGVLSRGHNKAKVKLLEVKPPDSRPILGEYPRRVPSGVPFYLRVGLVDPPGRPDQFEAAAYRLALFDVEQTADA
jgi:hypothetical protein